MDDVKRWTVAIGIDKHDRRTRAIARLRTRDTDRMVGVGPARLDLNDRDVDGVTGQPVHAVL